MKNDVIEIELKDIVPEQKKEMNLQDALIQIVQRTDIDPDRLEKFLDLQIKMENRQAEQALSKALSEFQKECPIIKKTKKSHNSNYAPYDEIKHIVQPIAHKHGLSWSFTVNDKSASEKEMIITVRHTQGAQFQSSYSFPAMDDGGKMNASQRTKSANSYAKRASLENALDIATTEMDDDARRAIDNPASPAQISEIEKLIIDTKSDIVKFKAAFQIRDISDFSELEAKDAIHALKEKRSHAMKPKTEKAAANV